MKILAFTDTHGFTGNMKTILKKDKQKKPELAICCGDFTTFENNMSNVLKTLSKLSCKLFLIHGNHETDKVLKKLCKKYKNMIFIHKKFYKQNNHIFFGYGGSGFALIEPDFYKTGEKFQKIIKKNKSKKIIFITHAPPYKTKLDLVVGSHCGNKTLKHFIVRNKVDLYICGHLHENFGKKDIIKKTKIINPGPYGKIIKIWLFLKILLKYKYLY